MSVIKFPTKYRPPPSVPAQTDTAKARRRNVWAVSISGLALAWTIIRVPVFLLLYWLRMPVVLLCNLISIPSLFAFLFTWYAFPEHENMVWAFGAVSFITFVGGYFYDVLLMAVAPGEFVRAL